MSKKRLSLDDVVAGTAQARRERVEGLSCYTGPLVPQGRLWEVIVQPGECLRFATAADVLAYVRKHS